MITDIQELNFPEYATLSTATATLVDMGDKTITAQVKIDGSIAPDFSYDWEIIFQGERYIHPLREPQASKGNESISSVIDLTFYHKGIYDLKRYFFVSIAETEAGTIMADNYIVPLSLNLKEFIDYLNKVLKFYYGNTYSVDFNPEYEYDETDRKYIDINYTKIWDVFTQIYEWFGVRWSWETQQDDIEYYSIKIGYPSAEVSHIFQYGFEGGLLKFEQQVQNAEIANKIFGRGSTENLPYRYFKDADPNNTTFPADPDWIPELANVYFSELRGKTFRDYVRGWKAKHYGGPTYIPPTDAYRKGYTDEKFDPVEYVEDKDSIEQYGEIQKGLDNNEDIKPTIQGVSIEGIGRVDEVVAVEQVSDDNSNDNITNDTITNKIGFTTKVDADSELKETDSLVIECKSLNQQVPKGYKGYITPNYNIKVREECLSTFCEGQGDAGVVCDYEYIASKSLEYTVSDFHIINASTGEKVIDFDEIPPQKEFYIEFKVKATGFTQDYDNIENNAWGDFGHSLDVRERTIYVDFDVDLICSPFNGDIISNYKDEVRIYSNLAVEFGKTKETTLRSNNFTITQDKSFILDVDVNVITFTSPSTYAYAIKGIKAINVDTQQEANILNLSKGTYYLDIVVAITNEEMADGSEPLPFLPYKIELLPTYIYYSSGINGDERTFNIWIKDIWGSKRIDGEDDDTYADRVWTPILGNGAKVIFSSGLLSGYSNYEFPIVSYAYDDTQTYNGVKSHWRLTLAKIDAEVESTGNWLPSTQIQGKSGDYFYFVGIELPHQYVLWAEEKLDEYKRKELSKLSSITPTILVHTDSIRINEKQDDDRQELIKDLRIGNSIKVRDFRFIKSDHKVLRLQSISYSWGENTNIYPNVEIVLSNEVVKASNALKAINATLVSTQKSILLVEKKSIDRLSAVKSSTDQKLLANEFKLSKFETRLTLLESNSSVEEVKLLKEQVNKNTTLLVQLTETSIPTIENKLVEIDTDLTELESRVTNVERRVTIAVVTPNENSNN